MSIFSRTKTPATDFEAATHAVEDITGDYTLDVTHTPPRVQRAARDGDDGPR